MTWSYVRTAIIHYCLGNHIIMLKFKQRPKLSFMKLCLRYSGVVVEGREGIPPPLNLKRHSFPIQYYKKFNFRGYSSIHYHEMVNHNSKRLIYF